MLKHVMLRLGLTIILAPQASRKPHITTNFTGRAFMKKFSVVGATLVVGAMLSAAPMSVHLSPAKTLSVSLDRADARIGRPLTPGSVAGVHRRVHRRAYVGAAAVGAAAAGAYHAHPACGYYPYPPCY